MPGHTVSDQQIKDLLDGFRKSIDLAALLLTLSRQMAELSGSGRQLNEAELTLYRSTLEQTETTLGQLRELVDAWPLIVTPAQGPVH